ncbi:HEAT repeat-containing protein 4 [Sorochytrium milnesiophthora]
MPTVAPTHRARTYDHHRSLFSAVEGLRDVTPDPATQRPHRKALMKQVLQPGIERREQRNGARQPVNAVAEAMDKPFSLRRPPRLPASYEAHLRDVDKLRHDLALYDALRDKLPAPQFTLHFDQDVLDTVHPITKGYEELGTASAPRRAATVPETLLRSQRKSHTAAKLQQERPNTVLGSGTSAAALSMSAPSVRPSSTERDASATAQPESRKPKSRKGAGLPALRTPRENTLTAGTRVDYHSLALHRSPSRRSSVVLQTPAPTARSPGSASGGSPLTRFHLESRDCSVDESLHAHSSVHAVLSPTTQTLLRRFVRDPEVHPDKPAAANAGAAQDSSKTTERVWSGREVPFGVTIAEPGVEVHLADLSRKDKTKIDRMVVKTLAGITKDDICELGETASPRLTDRANRLRVLAHPADVRIKWAHAKSLAGDLVSTDDLEIVDAIEHFNRSFQQQTVSRTLGNFVEDAAYTVDRDVRQSTTESQVITPSRHAYSDLLDESSSDRKLVRLDRDQLKNTPLRKQYIDENKQIHGQIFEAFLASARRYKKVHEDDENMTAMLNKMLEQFPPVENHLLPRNASDPRHAVLLEAGCVLLKSPFLTLSANAAKLVWVLLTRDLAGTTHQAAAATEQAAVTAMQQLSACSLQVLVETFQSMVRSANVTDRWFGLRALCCLNKLSAYEWEVIESRLGDVADHSRDELVDLLSSLDLGQYLGNILDMAETRLQHSSWSTRQDATRVLYRVLERVKIMYSDSWAKALGKVTPIEADNGEKYFVATLSEWDAGDQSEGDDGGDNESLVMQTRQSSASTASKPATALAKTVVPDVTPDQAEVPLDVRLSRLFQRLAEMMVSDWNETVRHECAESLARLSLVYPLMRHTRQMLCSGDPTRRVDGVRMVGAVRVVERQTWHKYLAAFRDDFIMVRLEACRAAFVLGFCHSKLVRALVERLEDSDARVRMAAVKALTTVAVEFKDQSFVPAVLLRFLSHETHPQVKSQVLQTVCALTYSPRFPSMHGPLAEEVKAVLIEHYRSDASEAVRQHAERALVAAGVNLASVVVAEVGETDEHVIVREVREMTERGKVLKEVMALVADD